MGFKMAFWLGGKIKSLSCYLQKAVEWQKPQNAAFSDWKQKRCGETEKRDKMKLVKADTVHVWTWATDSLFLWNEKNRVWWKAKTNEVFSSALKQLPCMNSLWQPLQGNSAIIFSPIFFFPWKTEKQSNWKLTHNLMELQSWHISRVCLMAWAACQFSVASGLGLNSISIQAFKVNPSAVLTQVSTD